MKRGLRRCFGLAAHKDIVQSRAKGSAALATQYKYDVFFSYKRDRMSDPWMFEVADKLKHWVGSTIGRAEIFVDMSSIPVGSRWPDDIQNALQESKCLVTVWSPDYFRSAWCLSEWRSFVERENRLGKVPLIAPIKYSDGECFPDEAKDVQWADFSDFAFTVPGFWHSQRAVEFEAQLKGFAERVATLIRSAPPFQSDWPLVLHEDIQRPNGEFRRL